jgi:hypothetical protein
MKEVTMLHNLTHTHATITNSDGSGFQFCAPRLLVPGKTTLVYRPFDHAATHPVTMDQMLYITMERLDPFQAMAWLRSGGVVPEETKDKLNTILSGEES